MVISRVQEAIAFALALGCVVALVPLVRRLCIIWGIFDVPGHLKIHREPIPRWRGVAIVRALAAGGAAWR
jgi:UDP-N-acetylmuramyl pentapeptide phosphotransferase/UDP-N-acetylglucosamine-1-phosphate transferase